MQISEIKQRLTIMEVLHHYGYKPTAGGAMQCPFHERKAGVRKKTMQIYADTNRYHCFHKDCGAGNGDVIDFIEREENCTKHQAIERAKLLLGVPVSADTHDARADEFRRKSGSPDPSGPAPKSEPVPRSGPSANHRPGAPATTAPASGVFTVRSSELLHYEDDTLAITVMGGIRLEGLDRLRCTLKLLDAKNNSKPGLRHTLDLYHDDQLQKLVRKTAERLELGTSKIEAALYHLTDHLEAYRLEALEKKRETKTEKKLLTAEEKKVAIAFLKQENLMQRTNRLLGESGIVGEEKNRQILWLVYSSRKRPRPLHVICLGASGTGKTYLQEKVARFVGEDEKFTFTASTENAFYYLEPYDLCHKLVMIEDMDGAQYLLYPLRELQTKHWISKVVPIKDSQGNMKTRKLEVYGPICLSGATTKEKLYEDNANRCLLLHLDNSAVQQDQIMDYQRKLSAGKVDVSAEDQAATLLENIQIALNKVKIINPCAPTNTIYNS